MFGDAKVIDALSKASMGQLVDTEETPLLLHTLYCLELLHHLCTIWDSVHARSSKDDWLHILKASYLIAFVGANHLVRRRCLP